MLLRIKFIHSQHTDHSALTATAVYYDSSWNIKKQFTFYWKKSTTCHASSAVHKKVCTYLQPLKWTLSFQTLFLKCLFKTFSQIPFSFSAVSRTLKRPTCTKRYCCDGAPVLLEFHKSFIKLNIMYNDMTRYKTDCNNIYCWGLWKHWKKTEKACKHPVSISTRTNSKGIFCRRNPIKHLIRREMEDFTSALHWIEQLHFQKFWLLRKIFQVSTNFGRSVCIHSHRYTFRSFTQDQHRSFSEVLAKL